MGNVICVKVLHLIKVQKIVNIFFLLILSATNWAQDVNIGVTFGFNAYQRTDLDRAIYSPANSYFTYVEEDKGKGLMNDNGFLNSAYIGVAMNYSWKRINCFLEPQFFYQRSYYNPYAPYNLFRVLGKKAFRMPIYITLNWFKKATSPYFLIGINLIHEKNIEFQSPDGYYYFGSDALYNETFFVGDNHFEGLLYQDGTYFNYMVGIGKKFKRFYGAINYQNKLRFTKHTIEANIQRVEISTTFILFNTEKLRKKHFLYVE